jgi:hypothetical protein
MADNYNITTTQGQANEAAGLDQNNPAMTYVDFGNQLARNSTEQARQAELVQQAMELTKQQKLKTGQETAASDLGINPSTKGYLSKDEALALIQAELSRQKLLSDDVKAQLQQWYDAAPAMVEQQSVKDFISRYQPKSAKNGVPFVATDVDAADKDKTDETGKPLIEGQMYSAVTDADGNVTYERGGQEKSDGSDKLALKESEAAEKQWQKLDTEMNRFIRSSRGNSLTQAAQRAVRALNELGEGQPLTAQMLSFIQKDISGIFQGGVPPISGMDSEDFTNVLQKVNQLIAKYTGVQGYLHHDLGDQRQYLLGLLMRLRDSTTDMLKSALASEAGGYEQIIHADPDRWQRMMDGKLAAVQAGLSQNAQTTVDAMKETPQGNLPAAMTPAGAPTAAPAQGTAGPDIHALASALGLKKKAQ